MSNFSPLERAISGFLARSPAVRAQLKKLYQQINFLVHGERGFDVWLASGVRLSTPSRLIGAQEPSQDVAEFFGYFDASPWSFDGRYYVVNQTRDVTTSTTVVLYDLHLKRCEYVGSTPVATWQQGTMCRWLTYEQETYLTYNSVEDCVLGTRLFSPADGKTRFLPMPLQAVNQARSKIYAINYLRLHRNGTEYGYKTDCDNLSYDQSDDNDGIWSVDIATGTSLLSVSLKQLLENETRPEMRSATSHEVNHLAVAPNGDHLAFVHRFRGPQGQFSRLYICSHDGRDLRLLLDERMVSHYAWLDSERLIAWARTRAYGDRYYLINIDTTEIESFACTGLHAWGDGHPSYHSGTSALVTDSYPDRKRQQHLLLVDDSQQCVEIARFLLPLSFSAAERVDLHPRWSPDGRTISIDSGFSGLRRNYLLDISSLSAPS